MKRAATPKTVVNFMMNDGPRNGKMGNEWMLDSNVKKDLKVLKRMEVHSTAEGGKKERRRVLSWLYTLWFHH